MDSTNAQQNKFQVDLNEIEEVLQYFDKQGYKRTKDSVEKLVALAKEFPDKDLVECAKEMQLWFSEAKGRGRSIKSFHLTFRNWVKKDYAPKRKPKSDFFGKEDLV